MAKPALKFDLESANVRMVIQGNLIVRVESPECSKNNLAQDHVIVTIAVMIAQQNAPTIVHHVLQIIPDQKFVRKVAPLPPMFANWEIFQIFQLVQTFAVIQKEPT